MAEWGFSNDRFQRRGQVLCLWMTSSKHGPEGRLSLIPEWWEAEEGIVVKKSVTEGVEERGHI